MLCVLQPREYGSWCCNNMVCGGADGGHTWSEHSMTPRDFKSPPCTPETNIILGVNSISVKKPITHLTNYCAPGFPIDVCFSLIKAILSLLKIDSLKFKITIQVQDSFTISSF